MNSQKSLAIALSKLKLFEQPKMGLEQYPTPSNAAASILWNASMTGLIEGKDVVDLGSGTGILAIGAVMLGARRVQAVELDEDAIRILEENKANLELGEELEIIKKDVKELEGLHADLVIMNPPFGTKEKHNDREFLTVASEIADDIYSFHKRSTRNYILAIMEKKGFELIEEFPFNFSLKASMKAHRKHSHIAEISSFHFHKRPTKDL